MLLSYRWAIFTEISSRLTLTMRSRLVIFSSIVRILWWMIRKSPEIEMAIRSPYAIKEGGALMAPRDRYVDEQRMIMSIISPRYSRISMLLLDEDRVIKLPEDIVVI